MSPPDGGDAPSALAGVDIDKVSAWYAANIPGTAAPLRFTLIAGGRSNLTYRVDDAAGHATVLRRPPTGPLLPTAHDMAREHRIIAAMGPAGIPVAPALGLCTDVGVTGAPFYVMGFVDGLVLRNAEDVEAGLDLPARTRVALSLVETLAALHAVDPDAVGLGDLAKREGYLSRQLSRWHRQYQASQQAGGPDVALIDEVHSDLVRSLPPQVVATVVHGDYRLDNTVVSAAGDVAAVLDWELATLGDPLADLAALLAYWTASDEVSPLGSSPTMAPGFASRQEVVDLYATASGRPVDRIGWYLAFAYWKLACILEGVYARYKAGAMGDTGFDFSFYVGSIEGLAGRARATLSDGKLGQ